MYRYYRPLSTIRRPRTTGDCVVNTLCALNKKSWEENFMDVCKIACRLHLMPDTIETVDTYAMVHGWVAERVIGRVTFAKFCELHPKGKYAVSGTDHIAAVIDGYLLDSWNSSRKIVRCAFKVP